MAYVVRLSKVKEGVQVFGYGKSMVFKGVDFEDLSDGIQKWQAGELIQNALPFLSADEREFLITGLLPEDWNELFGEKDES